MGSYVEEFKNNREKKAEVIVVVGGPSKSGKSTLAKQIAEKMDIKHISGGDIFREIADEKGITVEELSEKADKETDMEVDRRVLEEALKESCVIDSRIAAWVLGDFVNFSIHLTAEIKERARRMTLERDVDLKEAREKIEKRDQDNRRRYRDYYGIDTQELEIYDAVVDTTELSIEEQEKQVNKILRQSFPDRIE